MTQTILVTGGAGFIGGCFVRQLLPESDARVVNLDKLTYAGNLDSLAPVASDPRHAFIEGDIGDGALVTRLLDEHEVEAVVNFAAESHVDRSIDGPRQFVETNVLGTLVLGQSYLDRARAVGRLPRPAAGSHAKARRRKEGKRPAEEAEGRSN